MERRPMTEREIEDGEEFRGSSKCYRVTLEILNILANEKLSVQRARMVLEEVDIKLDYHSTLDKVPEEALSRVRKI